MKKHTIYIILTCVALSCLAGCKQVNKVTPTNATHTDTTSTQITANQNEVSSSKQLIENNSAVQSNQSTAKKAEVKQSVSTIDKTNEQSKQTNQQSKPTNEQSKQTNEATDVSDISAMPTTQNVPSFTSIAQMELFYRNGIAQNDSQASVLNATNIKQGYYYRPMASEKWLLQKIDVYPTSSAYHYNFGNHGSENNNCDLAISVNNIEMESNKKLFEHVKTNYQTIVKNSIEYAYFTSSSNSVHIVWKQFGITQSAILYSHIDKIEEFIPLLKIEQVTINLNSDHVTQ